MGDVLKGKTTQVEAVAETSFKRLANKQADEHLQHVGSSQTTRKQEGPFHSGKQACSLGNHVDIFHDALVQKGFAHIAVQPGHTRKAGHGDAHCQHQQRLILAEAADLIKVKGMGGAINHTCRREQNQLYRRGG